MTPPKPAQIDASDIERLARAATPGPWWTDITNGPGGAVCRSEEVRAHGHFNICGKASDSPRKNWIKNAAFIAAANPEAVLAMCSELKRLQAENESLREIVDDAMETCDPSRLISEEHLGQRMRKWHANMKAIDQPRAT